MDLRHYLHVLRRNVFVLVLAILVATSLAALQHSRQESSYESTAAVLLRPENLPDSASGGSDLRFEPERYASVELAVITSPRLAEAAAALVPGFTTDDVLDSVSASVDEDAAIVRVLARATTPELAAQLANAVATTYVDGQVEGAVGSLTRAIDELENSLTALEGRLAEIDVAANPNSPDLIAIREQYSTTFGQQQDLVVQRDLQGPTAEILAVAVAPTSPSGLGLPTKLVLAALLGAAIGFGLAFAREELDDGVRSREEVVDLTGMPVLVELPVDRQSSRSDRHIAIADDSLGRFAEGIRSLRTSITFLGSERAGGIRRLLVTSTVSGDGKTIVAANLGVAYAQAGYRTVLVSADLRRPRLERLFDVEVGQAGLAEALRDGRSAPISSNGSSSGERTYSNGTRATHQELGNVLKGVIVETRAPDLWLLPAGASVPNPSELLSSSRMDDVLAQLTAAFDMVIIDTSPLLAVTDAAALASKIGHVVLVAGMPATSRRGLARAAEMVKSTHAEVLGLVLNKVTGRSASFGGDYRPRTDVGSVRDELPATVR